MEFPNYIVGELVRNKAKCVAKPRGKRLQRQRDRISIAATVPLGVPNLVAEVARPRENFQADGVYNG